MRTFITVLVIAVIAVIAWAVFKPGNSNNNNVALLSPSPSSSSYNFNGVGGSDLSATVSPAPDISMGTTGTTGTNNVSGTTFVGTTTPHYVGSTTTTSHVVSTPVPSFTPFPVTVTASPMPPTPTPSSNPSPSPSSSPSPTPTFSSPTNGGVILTAMNGSGVGGNASLTAAGTGSDIVVNLSSGASNVTNAYLYIGTCQDLGSIYYTLNSVGNGSSTTHINVSPSDLRNAESHLSVVLYGTSQSVQTQYACGTVQ